MLLVAKSYQGVFQRGSSLSRGDILVPGVYTVAGATFEGVNACSAGAHAGSNLARVSATFILLMSARKPMEVPLPDAFALTHEKITTSASLPCGWAVIGVSMPNPKTPHRSITCMTHRSITCRTALYILAHLAPLYRPLYSAQS